MSCLFGLVIVGMGSENSALEAELVKSGEENLKLEEENSLLEEENVLLEEEMKALSVDVQTLTYLNEGKAEEIRRKLSAFDMDVLGVYPVGEDSSDNIKRFYVCDGRYYAEFYLVDYLTGEISDLSKGIPGVYIAWDEEEFAWDILTEDMDGDGMEDILVVVSSDERADWGGTTFDGAIFLWLQRDGKFIPVNRNYCNDTKYRENVFSQEIDTLEKKLRLQENADAWEIASIGTWIQEELFADRREELEELLEDKEKDVHYTERREPEDVHVTVKEDANKWYQVSIPENPYSEKKINAWFADFYERDVQATEEFMGVGMEENDVYMSEEERIEAGFYRNTSFWEERADDAIISFMGNVYAYMGGAHGLYSSFAVNFDSRNGECLQLEDILSDSEGFYEFAMPYIENVYSEFPWGEEDVRDALMGGDWCATNYGIMIFVNGGNGLGIFEYQIPYELMTDYMKEQYLPTSRTAEFNFFMGDGAYMDVNADGRLDYLTEPVKDDRGYTIQINGTKSNLSLEYDRTFSDGTTWEDLLDGAYFGASDMKLVRDEEGVTHLELKFDTYKEEKRQIVFVYRIEEETVIFEKVV